MLDLKEVGILDPDPQKYENFTDPDPRGKSQPKINKKNFFTLKTQI